MPHRLDHAALHRGHADETCSASAGWAHRASPMKDMIEGQRLRARWERGVDPEANDDGRLWRKGSRPRAERQPARVLVSGSGRASMVTLELQDLLQRVPCYATEEFREDCVRYAKGRGGVEVEPGVVSFPDGSRLVARTARDVHATCAPVRVGDLVALQEHFANRRK